MLTCSIPAGGQAWPPRDRYESGTTESQSEGNEEGILGDHKMLFEICEQSKWLSMDESGETIKGGPVFRSRIVVLSMAS